MSLFAFAFRNERGEIDSLECAEKAQIFSPTMHLKKALMRRHLKPERETNSFRNVLFIISVDFCRLAARQKRKLFRLVIALHKLSQYRCSKIISFWGEQSSDKQSWFARLLISLEILFRSSFK